MERTAVATRTVPVVASVVAVAGGLALGVLALSLLALREPLAHAGEHAVVAVATAALFFLAIRYWPPPVPRAVGRAARLVLVAGLGVFAVAQAVEAVGAFDFRDVRTLPWLDDLHGAALYPGTLGLLLMILGALASVLVALAARFNLLESRWMFVVLAVPVTAVALFVLGALVFGY